MPAAGASIGSLRKFLPIALLVVLFLPLLAPLFSGGLGGETSLPACCRRNGMHHCAMIMLEKNGIAAASDSKGPLWKRPLEQCPYCPAMVVSWHHQQMFAPSTAQAIFAEFLGHPSGTVQTESRRRISRDRSRQKRGPPNLSLA